MTHYWAVSGAIPVGVRKLPDSVVGAVLGAARPGTVWVDMCNMGQHLPQMYPLDDLYELTVDGCARLALCPDCFGFGDQSPFGPRDLNEAARSLDEIKQPCVNCGGTGRPALRITMKRDAHGLSATILPLPHVFVPPIPEIAPETQQLFGMLGACLACGMPQDGKGPRGRELHT